MLEPALLADSGVRVKKVLSFFLPLLGTAFSVVAFYLDVDEKFSTRHHRMEMNHQTLGVVLDLSASDCRKTLIYSERRQF